MSNANLVARIEALLRSLESGEIAIQMFAQEFPAHFEAIENIEYSSIQDAEELATEFECYGYYDADGFGNHEQMVSDTVRSVRDWLKSVPR